MTMLGDSIQSYARERATLSRSLETIKSEVTESYSDGLFESVANRYYTESVEDGMDTDEEIDEFIDELDDSDVDKEIEIENIMDEDDDFVDIDDIIGVTDQ